MEQVNGGIRDLGLERLAARALREREQREELQRRAAELQAKAAKRIRTAEERMKAAMDERRRELGL